MKHQTLRLAASCLNILTWIVIVVGIAISFIIGLGSATVIAKISFLLGGFVVTAISGLVLLITSRLIHLFIEIEEDLSRIAENTKREK
jgi:hypothetical protein